MTRRENYFSLVQRKGYTLVPIEFNLCPSLVDEYHQQTNSTLDVAEYFDFTVRNVSHPIFNNNHPELYQPYYQSMNLKPDTTIDGYGVAHEPGSDAAMHMTRMISPLATATTSEELLGYPYPQVDIESSIPIIREQVNQHRQHDRITAGGMACSVWEHSWYIRSMEQLMMDMVMDEEKAAIVLDHITAISCDLATVYASSGVDVLQLGDDIGMQQSIMMSKPLYQKWLKPRLKKIIDTARSIHPDVLIFYHSCGFIEPFIDDLIEVGVDILNPIQPECMDFQEIHHRYGDRISFHGTIGTQTTMPFGTPDEVARQVTHHLNIAGSKGGLLPAPTHLLEPEVPWDNIMAYIDACREYQPQ